MAKKLPPVPTTKSGIMAAIAEAAGITKKLARTFYFETPSYVNNDPASYRDATGYVGHYIFSAPSNTMSALGFANNSTNSRLRFYDVRTTVDWAFDNSKMTVWWGNDARWDLCGTEQRVGQFDVQDDIPGNPSVVTNTSATPATLRMGMIFSHGGNAVPPNIRFGGNLSVIFENNIYNTYINYEMTAKGNLTVQGGTGTSILHFLENGSWANATNVTVNGTGKITIANPNVFGRKANVNLASNSSLEIDSGVTVTVRSLTVGGVKKADGDYTFGSGTLRVFNPGLMLILR